MSEDSKPGDKGKCLSRRNKFLDNASAAIELVYLYDRNEVDVIKRICSRECFPKGKYGRNTHKKQQKAFQANGNGQKIKRTAYCQVQNCKPAEDVRELQQNQKRNKTLTNQILPKVDYSKYNTKSKSKKWNEAYEVNHKIKPFKCVQEKVSKIYPKKLSTQSNWSCVSVYTASSAMTQISNDLYEQFQTQLRLPTPKANIWSYKNTVAVYSVYDQRPRMPKSKKETCYLGSGTSFSLQFYKSMGDGQPMSRGGQAYVPGDGRHMSRGGPAYIPGDGRQMFRASPVYIPGDGRQISRGGPAYILLPENYSVSRLRRDEDGCICANIPQDDYGYENNLTNNHEGGSFLKRYLRVLMKEQKRCVCRQHKKRQLRSCRTCNRNVGCQCKCNNNNDRINFLGNDAACQCKYRENGEHRSDRDSFYRERGITCYVPKTPTQCSRCSSENMFNTYPQRPEIERQTVNIGSNFSFKMRFYKRRNNSQPNPDDGCSYNIPACDEPCCKPTSCCSTPKLKCKSSSTKSARRGGDSCSCSKGKSSETICCCPAPQPDRCYSPCRVPSFVPCKSSKTKNKNKSVASCCSTCILPVYIESKKKKKKNPGCAGVCCGTICNMPVSKKSDCNKLKNIGCCCNIKPIIVKSRNNRKSIEICCNKCKRPKKVEGYCCCNEGQKSTSLLSLISKNQSGSCCETPANNEPVLSLRQKLIDMFFKKPGSPCKTCNSMFNERLVPTKDAQCGCKCQEKVGDFDYKNVLRSMTSATERRRQAKAQQCPCKGYFDYRKLFGRLLLFNVHEETCCSSETCGKENNSTFSKSVGIGEADLRKPPCQRRANTCPRKNNYYLKKIFSRLIKQETLYVRQQRMFDPLNQSVAAVQHCSSDGPNERVGKEIICRNQGSSVPKCKQITLKDYENSAMASPAEPVDPNQKTIRLGSNCSFSVELYRGPPPSKSSKLCPPCSPCAQPCAESPANNLETCSAPCSDECETPTVPFVQKAFASMILRNQKPLANKSTCQRCNKCTKVPLIKRGFAQLLLTDSKQRKRNRICQKTNTLQPVRRVVKRRPGSAAGAQGKPNCNPYVCLKRANQSRCCNKTK